MADSDAVKYSYLVLIMNKLHHLFSYLVIFGLPLLITSAFAESRTYTVGVVPQFAPLRTAEIWQPILEEVSRSSGIHLQLKSSPSIPDFEQQCNAGGYDFAYMNPYHLIVTNQSQGYRPLLRDNGRQLHGIIVIKKDSDVQSVDQLNGKIIAFPSPNALGAALIPRAELHEKFNLDTRAIYVKSHSSVYLNVLLGKATAGGGVQKTLSQQPSEIRDQLRILYKTTEIAPHPLTVHPSVTQDVQNKISQAFLTLGSSEQGAKLLNKIPMKKIGPASLEDYDALKKMGLHKYYISQ